MPGAVSSDAGEPRVAGIGFAEFVALIALILAAGALGVDLMLPSLSAISHDVGMADANQRQWVVTAYLLGLGAPQLLYGVLADRYGRKPVLMGGLLLYTVFGAVAAFTDSFAMLVGARALQGAGAACGRVVGVAVIRDCFAGNRMARVMSLAMAVFLAVPIVAPLIGQLVLMIGPWRWLFGLLAGFGLLSMAWIGLRLQETLPAGNRLPIAWTPLKQAARDTLCTPVSAGYTLAVMLMTGALFGFINTAQQLFTDAFEAPALFPLAFSLCALSMVVASTVNARIVVRLGMRRVSHTAMVGLVAVSLLHAGVVLAGWESLVLFVALQAATMFCFCLAVPNFGALAMEPLGHVAGIASAVQGFVGMVGGALLGFAIGQQFDGTAQPLVMGYLALGTGALVTVLVTERGLLFGSRSLPAAVAPR